MPACPKPLKGAAAAERQKRSLARARLDRAENAKVKARSGGSCEVRWRYAGQPNTIIPYRCSDRAVHVHHMIGGRGTRGVGLSRLADHKQHVCSMCHREIGGGVGGRRLRRIGGAVPQWDDVYARVRD